MKNPVIGIGLEGCDPVLLEEWMAQGHLKNLKKVRDRGAYGRLSNKFPYSGGHADCFATEPLWGMALTGCYPTKTGFWDAVRFHPETYTVSPDKIYHQPDYPHVHELGETYRVITFDVPVTRISDKVNGWQIQGWGGHFPWPPSLSKPEGLLTEINQKYGSDPLLYKDDGKWWNKQYVKWVPGAIQQSANLRARICCDLMQRQPWDLFLTVFGDIHAAGHDLYDQSLPDHPLYPLRKKEAAVPNPLLQSYQEIDEAVGKIIDNLPENAYLLFFSVHGMAPNHTDVLSMFTIAELLYRFSFPGQVAMGAGKAGATPPPYVSKPIRKGWGGEIWRTMQANPIQKLINTWAPKRWVRSPKKGLLSPYELKRNEVAMDWSPTMLYSGAWPEMKAFAIPAFANGHVRINLQGRERDGIVPPSEYDALCEELTQVFYRLRDARTGQPIVKQVVRTRQSPLEDQENSRLPMADLVVVWHEIPTDVVDSPDFGRIGPVTMNRPGGHRPRGFLLAQGPGIEPGSDLPEGEAVDLAPTILSLLEAPIPGHYDGKPLIQISTAPLV
ncbi:alkaline phosphatase family protein [Thermoleptolyngbya sichuanensis XZ-Cy5]|uniref:alkaline phosphatase family protein n=1 Tax=Thermoleptolyngbya sichuanensis TaxID=2885951 RepID=UPI00240E63D2|nr:alkaline phosphatase family protein [Thermoleptolyngbya sichuanensis]MDG2615281.1 alkaline phosphatase family protein [Thermoleptolyngbya sichuanensis XZ-Cy5]